MVRPRSWLGGGQSWLGDRRAGLGGERGARLLLMSELRIRITGPDADALSRELAARLHAELGGDYVPRPATELETEPGEAQRADPIAVAGLILAIPGAVLAAVDLAARLKLVEKWKALRAWVAQRIEAEQRVEIEGETLLPKALTEAEPGEVIDAAIRAEKDRK